MVNRRFGSERRVGPRRTSEIYAHKVAQMNPKLKSALSAVLVCWAMVATVGVVAASIQTHNDNHAIHNSTKALRRANQAIASIEHQQAIQNFQIRASCQRLNIQRAVINAANKGEFVLLNVALLLQKSKSFTHALRLLISKLSWTPLTNCISIVQISGRAYNAPQPIPFIVQIPPPSSLDTINARLSNPVGSLP